MYIDSSYKGDNYGFPKDDIHPDLKNKKWYLDVAKALYASFVNDSTSVAVKDYADMLIGRMYGAGKQNSDQYKDILIGKKDEADGSRKGWANINFEDIISVAPKFRRIVIGIFESQEHELVVSATDENSKLERADIKWKMWAQKEHKDIISMVDKITNANTVYDEYEPTSIEELELFESMGGIKLQSEVALESALSTIEYESRSKMIKEKLIGDAIDIGVMIMKDYTDVATGMVLKKYVNPYESFYALDEDKKVARFGEIKYYTIENVRAETGLSEDELKRVARSYEGSGKGLFNPYLNERMNEDGSININYNDFIVPVLEFEVASVDVRSKTYKVMKDGSTVPFDEPVRTTKGGVVIPPKKWSTETKNTEDVGVKVFRRGKWIIGTEHLWDFGLQHDTPRPSKSRPKSSYHVAKLDGVSMMVACKPHFDQIQLANLKIQNALAMAPQAGIAYEFSSLSGMSVGKKGLDPLDIIKMHRQTGSFLFKATVNRGGMISPVSARPFLELKGGIGPLLKELVDIIGINLESIRDITGINQITDASSPNPETGLGVSELAVASTNNSLKPIYTNYINLKEESAENCVLRLQMIAKYKKGYQSYSGMGKSAWKTLDVSADFSLCQMGIKIQALPTKQEVDAISRALEGAVSQGRDGKPTITMSEYFAIRRILQSGGGLKLAQVMLAYREQKRIEDAERIQAENMRINAENAERQEKVKAEMIAALEKTKIETLRETKKIETDESIRLENAKHENKMKELQLQLSMKAVSQPAAQPAAVN